MARFGWLAETFSARGSSEELLLSRSELFGSRPRRSIHILVSQQNAGTVERPTTR